MLLKTPEPVADPVSTGRRNDRRCIVTGAALPPGTGMRFVRAPDGGLLPDLAGKLPGRGAWIEPTQGALLAAVKKGSFPRALKGPVILADGAEGLLAQVRTGLRSRALSALGLAKRSGALVSGYEKVRAGLKKGDFVAYIYASDGAIDGRQRMSKLISAQSEPCRKIGFFTGSEIDQATGSVNSVHLGLKVSGGGAAFLKECERLAGFVPADVQTEFKGRTP